MRAGILCYIEFEIIAAPILLMARQKGVWLATCLISNRWRVFHCVAAIWREEDMAIEDLNTSIRFIHDYKK